MLFRLHGDVSVSTKHAVHAALATVGNGSGGDLGREPQPAGVQAVEKAREGFGAAVELLDFVEQKLAEAAEQQIAADETIELVPVDGEMPLVRVVPDITLVNGHSDQVRHDVGKTLIVISLDPNHFHLAFWIGELANAGEELPMFAGKTAEVQVGKNISQQNQSGIAQRLQQVECFTGPAQLRSQVQVGNNQRVESRIRHTRTMLRIVKHVIKER